MVFPRHRVALFICDCTGFNHDCPDGHAYDNVPLLHRSAVHARKTLEAVVSVRIAALNCALPAWKYAQDNLECSRG